LRDACHTRLEHIKAGGSEWEKGGIIKFKLIRGSRSVISGHQEKWENSARNGTSLCLTEVAAPFREIKRELTAKLLRAFRESAAPEQHGDMFSAARKIREASQRRAACQKELGGKGPSGYKLEEPER
jgi:hypothetical protein